MSKIEKFTKLGLTLQEGKTVEDLEAIPLVTDLATWCYGRDWDSNVINSVLMRWCDIFFIRTLNHPLAMPYSLIGLLKPKHGDILLNFDADDATYRNNIVHFWHDKLGAIECDFHPDDYGSVPHHFAFPEFPIDYFRRYMEHNNIVHVDISTAIFSKDPKRASIKFTLEKHPQFIFNVKPWDDEIIQIEDLKGLHDDIVTIDIDHVGFKEIVCHAYYED